MTIVLYERSGLTHHVHPLQIGASIMNTVDGFDAAFCTHNRGGLRERKSLAVADGRGTHTSLEAGCGCAWRGPSASLLPV